MEIQLVFPDHTHLLFFKVLNTYIIGACVLLRKERASFSI